MTLDLFFSLSVSYYSFIYLHPHSFVISVFILSAQSSVITLIHRSLFWEGSSVVNVAEVIVYQCPQ